MSSVLLAVSTRVELGNSLFARGAMYASNNYVAEYCII